MFNYTMGAVVADLAKKEGDILRCHNLVWHSQLAPWVDSPAVPWTKASLSAALVNHIEHEAGHWAGRCYAVRLLSSLPAYKLTHHSGTC